jgi:uncharacterized protein YeaO (DUF488 family)
MSNFKVKRVYDDVSEDDGYRVLVDRLWPRGVKKEDADLDDWNKDIAPSADLRKWFNHEEDRFEEFSKRYKEELKSKKKELDNLREKANKETVCLLYSAKDEKINNARVLKDVLEKKE